MRITRSLCNQGRRQVHSAGLVLRRQKLCLGLVPLVSETGQHHPHASASAAAGGEIGGLRGPWIGRAEQDAARSHNSSYIETQYLFCMVNMDELCHIHQSCGLTYVLRDLMRACGRMPACVWEQYAIKRAGWMVMQIAASSRCEVNGACVTCDRWVLCWYTSNWTRTQECARPSVNSGVRRMYEWLHLCGKQFLFIL